MCVKSLRFDICSAVEPKPAFTAMLGGLLLNGLLLRRWWKNEQLAVGKDAVYVEQQEFDFLGAEFRHCRDSSIRSLAVSLTLIVEAFEHVLLGPSGPRNHMKTTSSGAQCPSLERRGRPSIGEVEAVNMSDPERALLSE